MPPSGAICIQTYDARTERITSLIAFCSVLHRHESRVIHCKGFYIFYIYLYIEEGYTFFPIKMYDPSILNGVNFRNLRVSVR